MIRVEIRLGHQGALRGFSVSGHSGTGSRGEDLVCAAVSVLFRTAARLLQLQPDVDVQGGAAENGTMELQVDTVPAERRQWLVGLSDFLIRGARDLQEENPGAISLRVSEGEA
ncbi:MAG: ribosomal-processing cysteine protease Prp [Spirochaetaceae bacterium]|nr:MAG: ribosomal-processing cysteine protease Prp [Spirochaetaceae bacterium]